ncbi:unnamed protein product [Closterium sp. Naga37s-1]|nr:unnamed protein product [Closterium sp. Naga37s-1]
MFFLPWYLHFLPPFLQFCVKVEKVEGEEGGTAWTMSIAEMQLPIGLGGEGVETCVGNKWRDVLGWVERDELQAGQHRGYRGGQVHTGHLTLSRFPSSPFPFLLLIFSPYPRNLPRSYKLGNIEATEKAESMLHHLTLSSPFVPPPPVPPSLVPPCLNLPRSCKLGNIEATEEAKRMLDHLTLSRFPSSPFPFLLLIFSPHPRSLPAATSWATLRPPRR